MGPAEVGHCACLEVHRIEGDPGGADAVPGQVEVPKVLVEGGGFGGSGFLDQDRILVEVDAVGVQQGSGDGRERGGGGEGGEGWVV